MTVQRTSRAASLTQDSNGLELPATLQAVGAARRHVQGRLGDGTDIATDLVDVVLLLTSELVSNAVLHGRAPIALLLRRQAAGVRIEVRDTGDMFALPLPLAEPEPELWSLSEEGGRGLLLVQALASRWGSTAHDVPLGKTVWCEIRPAAPPSAAAV